MSERMASCARLTSLMAIPPRKRTTSVAGAREAICRNESRRRSLGKTPNASFVSRGVGWKFRSNSLFLVRFSPRPALHHLIKIFWEFLAGFVSHAFSHLFGPAGHRLGIVHVPQLARIGEVFER